MGPASSLVGFSIVDHAPRAFPSPPRRPLDHALAIGLPTLGALLLEPRLELSLIRVAHVGHHLDVMSELMPETPYRTTATVAALSSGHDGDEVDVELVTRGPSEAIVVAARASVVVRGARRHRTHHDADAASLKDETVPTSATTTRLSLPRADLSELAAALGDHNPIYVDDDAARQAGLPGVIVPHLGVVSLVADALGLAVRQLRVSLKRPALATDTLTLSHWAHALERRFVVYTEAGAVVVAGRIGGAV
jgi:acyl dehydratase